MYVRLHDPASCASHHFMLFFIEEAKSIPISCAIHLTHQRKRNQNPTNKIMVETDGWLFIMFYGDF